MSIQILLVDSLFAAENSSDRVQKQVNDAVKQLPDEDHLLAAVIDNTSFSVVVPGTPIQKLPDDWIDTLIDQAHLMRESGVIPRSLAFSELGSTLSTLCLACGDFFDHSLTWINLLNNDYGAAINDVYPALAAKYPALDAAYPAIKQKLLKAEQILRDSRNTDNIQTDSDLESHTREELIEKSHELQEKIGKLIAENEPANNTTDKPDTEATASNEQAQPQPTQISTTAATKTPASGKQVQQTTTTTTSSSGSTSNATSKPPSFPPSTTHSESASKQPETSSNALHQPKYSFIPIILSLLSLLVLGCAMVINNLPELGIKTWPRFMDVPINTVAANNLPETVALMAILISCIVGLPRTVSIRIVLVIAADLIYLLVAIWPVPITWIAVTLSILAFGAFLWDRYDSEYWEDGSSYNFMKSKSSGRDFYRFTSTTKIFVYAIIIWAITIYPLSIAATRMCLPDAQRTASTEKTQTLEGLGVKELILCAGIGLIFALCTACMMAVHRQEGFWGSGIGAQTGLIICPLIIAVFSCFLSASINADSFWENLLWSITILGPIACISYIVDAEDFELTCLN
ncbi:hypothetical protein [Bifidobacterium sp. ESL0745]|uniref:hypothetical protein n=1 Tax=Bifidobacterium sp. ESL0745 TaxID=2983226 RepID=UPI0023F77A20|nr:hypothetical protein [Bifidobacterium sp. ESL0745]MDF7665527.1 hypothetical protein [Bifidobacterium sp. ESL0745]